MAAVHSIRKMWSMYRTVLHALTESLLQEFRVGANGKTILKRNIERNDGGKLMLES